MVEITAAQEENEGAGEKRTSFDESTGMSADEHAGTGRSGSGSPSGYAPRVSMPVSGPRRQLSAVLTGVGADELGRS